MELLGRETELASVDDAVANARSGGARALGLFGEAGIGKSALLGAAARAARRRPGCWCSRAAPPSMSASVPFGLIVDALDDHVATLHPRRVEALGPDLAAVLPAAASASTGAPVTAAAGAAERFRYHRVGARAARAARARATGGAAARRPALGRRGVGRARAAPAAPTAARAASARLRPARAGARARACSTPPAPRPAGTTSRPARSQTAPPARSSPSCRRRCASAWSPRRAATRSSSRSCAGSRAIRAGRCRRRWQQPSRSRSARCHRPRGR